MEGDRKDVGESTVTLTDDAAHAERRFYLRLGAVVLLAALAYVVWRIVEPLWQPLAWAALLGGLLAPLNRRLAARLGGRPLAATTVTMLATVLLFILPVVAVLGAVGVQAAHLLARLESGVPQVDAAVLLDLNRLPWLVAALQWLEETAHVSLEQLQGWLLQGARHVLQALMASGGTFLMGALGTVASFALMLFVLFFVLRDGPDVAARVMRMLPMDDHRRGVLSRHLADVTRAVFLGIGLTAVVQGLLVGVGFWITGLPSPLLFGVIAMLVSLIPMVGSALIWAPAALFLAARGEYGHAIFLAAWGVIVVGMVDNFLRPMLISGRAAVPTLAVFIGVMGGLAAFGFIGLFLGPIVLGLLVALFRYESEVLAAAHDGH